MNAIFFYLLAIGCLWVIGVWTLFQPGMILQNLGDHIEAFCIRVWGTVAGRMICKPLFTCPPCMASVHGSIIWFTFGPRDWLWWIPFLLCLCGFLKLVTVKFLSDD